MHDRFYQQKKTPGHFEHSATVHDGYKAIVLDQPEALTFLTQQRIRVNLDAFQGHLRPTHAVHCGIVPARHALGVCVHHENRYAVRVTLVSSGAGRDDQQICGGTVHDHRLVAIDDVTVALLFCLSGEIAQIKATSVIDTVAVDAIIENGDQQLVPIGGIAFSGDRGISMVEVRVDEGPWESAELRSPLSETTWVIWRFDWPFEAGEHIFEVRCAEGDGTPQIEESVKSRPSGATGIHSRSADL